MAAVAAGGGSLSRGRQEAAATGGRRCGRAERALTAALPATPPQLVPGGLPLSERRSSSSAAAFLAQEEEYKRLNAELEAKTAELVRQAEEVLKDQQEMLSRPLSAQAELFDEEAKHQRDVSSPELPVLPLILKKQLNKKKSSCGAPARPQTQPGKKGKGAPPSAKGRAREIPSAADIATPDFSLAKTIRKIEEQLEEGPSPDLEDDFIPSAGSELGAEAQIRFLKAKLRVMQEELDTLGQECNKKDEENLNLSSRLKEFEEERGRLQRTASLQQSQIEKYKTLSEEANRRSEGLQQKLSAQEKELENLKRAQKQASASQSTTEVRLNRALEEAERYKMELNKLKQNNKELVNQEHKKLEELKIENKRLEKQKGELMAGFKKQLKLIDILKRQKMHIESAKMLSFTEDEFMKALEWGGS
uniref:Testis expressed 9 n=1 Tax=Salvator merianae TaxID=96440 RepID=A0A8D0B2F0_SALMN